VILGRLNQNSCWQHLTISILFALNGFMKNLLMTKSIEDICHLFIFNGRASSPYKQQEYIWSSEANLPILPINSISCTVEGTFLFVYRALECLWLNNTYLPENSLFLFLAEPSISVTSEWRHCNVIFMLMYLQIVTNLSFLIVICSHHFIVTSNSALGDMASLPRGPVNKAVPSSFYRASAYWRAILI